MGWTTPISWTNILSDASHFNEQIRDNLLALKQPPTAHYEANESSNFLTFSTTYDDVDNVGSQWTFTFTTNGGDVLIGLAATGRSISSFSLLDVSVDGTRIANNASGGIRQITGTFMNVSFLRWIRGLSAGSHTFILQWKHNTGGANFGQIPAGAGTSGSDVHPRFWVREVS
jgi:hypothetical protein